MKIYVAGPMRGITLYNFPAFAEVTGMLRHWGHSVISPAELDLEAGFNPADLPPEFDWDGIPMDFGMDACLTRDIDAIRKCEAIYLLPGWEHSTGCRMEKAVAEFLRLKVIYVGDPPSPHYETMNSADLVNARGESIEEVGAREGEPVYWADNKPKGETIPNGTAILVPRGEHLMPKPPLPTDSAERKKYPMHSGLMAYFPNALAAVAHHSWKGNEKHHPGEPLHWSREKSNDHQDCLMRHSAEGDKVAVAWRALADLQISLEDGE